jgi:hypothetical protein
MRENRRKRNQISEMSFPRYKKTNKKKKNIYIYITHTHTHKKQNTCKISDFCLGTDETFVLWVVIEHILVVIYWSFRTGYRSHLQGSSSLSRMPVNESGNWNPTPKLLGLLDPWRQDR